MIIVDFIDMEEAMNRQEVAATLESELKKDRTKAFVMGWTKLGLLELTRKKVREESTLPSVSLLFCLSWDRQKIYFAIALIFSSVGDIIFRYGLAYWSGHAEPHWPGTSNSSARRLSPETGGRV